MSRARARARSPPALTPHRTDLSTLRGTSMTYLIVVGEGMQLGVAPTFHGFHPIWASAAHQVDICNNVDDVIIRDGKTGTLYRMPITHDFLPKLGELVAAMNAYDLHSRSPWMDHNARVRGALLYAAQRRLEGAKPQSLNMFEPGFIAPALDGVTANEVDPVLAVLVETNGDTRIPGQ
jgi:hypothetical protein